MAIGKSIIHKIQYFLELMQTSAYFTSSEQIALFYRLISKFCTSSKFVKYEIENY